MFITLYGKTDGNQQHSPFPPHTQPMFFSSSVFMKTKALLTTNLALLTSNMALLTTNLALLTTNLKTSKTYNFREA